MSLCFSGVQLPVIYPLIHPFSWLLIQLRFLRGRSLSGLPVYHRATCDLYPTKNTFVLLLKSTKHLKLMPVTFVEVIHNFDYFLCWIDLTQSPRFISCQYAHNSLILVSVHNKKAQNWPQGPFVLMLQLYDKVTLTLKLVVLFIATGWIFMTF